MCRTVVAAAVGGLAGGTATHLWHRFGPGTKWASEERRRLARAHQQRMHWELLSKAIDDPDLAVVIDNYGLDLTPQKRRQYMYANLWYINAFHLYEAGLLDLKELFGHLRELFQSPLICEYWEATRPHRAALDPASTEAEIGRMAEELFQEMAAAADTEEWWVVGEPPSD
ncbi:DUF6082 family protein [Streptomyces endophyticus]|uniref:DUF6082 family protein n=1 Tax=Streptomyces endophyticus TaxID=714166 RepID=A0ABU6FK37_9ACTN|nr:DUF6082 family protein [Streptomyces endophyticus]MEB8343152.1 DUF6082 family protein [Streptomyces endophyticus]